MDNIRIVLVRTYVSGNIGSASRAMKTMGLKHLTLVAPRLFPDEEATKMATRGAEDVLLGSRVVDTLYGAVHDCDLVIACTARPRSFDLPVLSPEQAAELLYSTANRRNVGNNNKQDDEEQPQQPPPSPASVALVFGPERAGLDNDDIQLAHYRVSIPANPENTSLNLASAVQILSYELRKCHNSKVVNDDDNDHRCQEHDTNKQLPTIAQMEGFYDTLESVLKDTGVAHKDDPRQLMQKMRHIFARAEPDKTELNLLRGAFATIQRKLDKK